MSEINKQHEVFLSLSENLQQAIWGIVGELYSNLPSPETATALAKFAKAIIDEIKGPDGREFWIVTWFDTRRHVEICETQEALGAMVLGVGATGQPAGVMKVREVEE